MTKRRFEELVVDDGVDAAKAILKLATGNLLQDDCVTHLPYPGIGVPPDRPPFHLAYIGSTFVFHVLEHFWGRKKRRLLIEGPRGFGKSSDLRALACLLHSIFALEKTKDVLVSIWNLNAALLDEVKVVKDALLFAYLVKWEGQLIVGSPEPQEAGVDALSEDEDDAEDEVSEEAAEDTAEEEREVAGEQQDKEAAEERIRLLKETQQAVENERKIVTEEIERIASMQEAAEFVEQRKREHGEVFHFFGDGWQVFDADNADRVCTREMVQHVLEGFFMHGASVTLALAASSTTLDERRPDTQIISKFRAFNEGQYDSYKKLSILGRLDQVRAEDIGFYTGRVPWLLEMLLECCDGFGRQTVADKMLASIRKTKDKRLGSAAAAKMVLGTYPTGDQLAEMLCLDDGAWAAVLSMFREKLNVVRKEIDKIVLGPGEQCQSMVSMGAKDKSHFIEAENRYCCGFIERMYIECFRAKEEAARQSARGVWIPYCRFLLWQPSVNWSSLGWLAEDLVGDVITHRTVYLGSSIGSVKDLKLDEFAAVPAIRIGDLSQVLKPGHGIYYKPRSHKLPYIDGLIVYKALDGSMYIIPVQVTANVDKHLASAPLFMRMENLRKWFPDLEVDLLTGAAQSTRHSQVVLAFVFIGSSKRLSGEKEYDQAAALKSLRNRTCCISPAYWMIYVPFVTSLGGDGGLNVEELETLEELVKRRSNNSVQLADVSKLRLGELVNLWESNQWTKKAMLPKVEAVTVVERERC